MITGQQIRAARSYSDGTYRLAPRASMGRTLLRQFEAGARVPDEESAARLKAALEEAGLIFTAGKVKLRPRPLGVVCTSHSTPKGRVKGHDHRRAQVRTKETPPAVNRAGCCRVSLGTRENPD